MPRSNPIYQVYEVNPLLATGTWGGTITVYQVMVNPTGNPKVQCNQMAQQKINAPILGMCWQVDAVAILIAAADNNIYKYDLQANTVQSLHQHQAPVKDVCSIMGPNNTSIVISGGWDCKVKFFTWSSPSSLNQFGESFVAMPIHYMSCVFPLLVTAH